MLRFLFLLFIFIISIFIFSDSSVKAQNSVDTQPSDRNSVESAEKKEVEEKTEKEESEPKEFEGNLYKLKRGTKNIEIVPGFAPMQPVFFSGRKEYNTEGRGFSMLNVRFTRNLGTRKGITYQYFFELTPLVVAFNNEVKNTKYISEKETPKEPKTIRKTAYGFGFQPVNFRFIFKPTSRIKPFVQIGAGMMFFNQKMPVPEATSYNFTGDFGGGVYILTDREQARKAITISYRYFHISNFNTSKFNPGYNANIFSVGYSFFH